VLAGHSIGGFIALLVALQTPECVQGLILSNTGAHTAGHGDPSLPNRIRSEWHGGTQADFLRACFRVQPPPDLWAHLLDYLARLPPLVLLEAVNGLRQLDVASQLRHVACPTLVAHGQFDKRRLIGAAEQLAAGIPDAELVLLPGGHTPMVDCPAEYQAAVEVFLSRVFATI
jgi:pimeloyl-ACP methyl ester carboxylesterase